MTEQAGSRKGIDKVAKYFFVSLVVLVVLASIAIMPTRQEGTLVEYGTYGEPLCKTDVIRLAPIFTLSGRNEENSITITPNLQRINKKGIYSSRAVYLAVSSKPYKLAFGYWLIIVLLPSILLALVIALVYSRSSALRTLARALKPSAVLRTSGHKWSWSFGKGISWALPVGIGALAGVKDRLALSIAFGGDASPLLFVFGAAGLALWLGGLRRVDKQLSEQISKQRRDDEADIRKRVANLPKGNNQ